ncbi:MAG TPA: hypothetical protein VEC38_13830 [Candidatus Binataceae bacterium]|nr:hypothetical protein [Candidatus Binataceae bacterium]
MTKLVKMPALAAAAASAWVAATARLACACAMCGAPPAGGAGNTYYDVSVLLTLAAPYLTAAAMGGMMFVAWRRSRRDEHPRGASPPPAKSEPASIAGAPGATDLRACAHDSSD